MYAHPSQLRAANRRRVFRLLLTHGGMSRADLARATGLSPMTAGKVCDDLVREGLIEEIESAVEPGPRPVMGRPPRNLSLSSSRELTMVELGVRTTTVMVQPLDLTKAARRTEFSTPRTAETLLSRLDSARVKLEASRTEFVLVSVPGVLDAGADRVLCSPNLPLIEEHRFLPRLGEVFHAKVCAVQEIQALALGHQAGSGAGRPVPESFVLVDFGDGVGGALVAGGQLFQGTLPMSGELGHTGVHGNHRACVCGSVGCVETLVSRQGLIASFRERSKLRAATWEMVQEHVAAKGIEPWLARSIDAAAVVIAGAINLVGTQDVVLTGDLPDLHAEIGPLFEHRISLHSLISRLGRLTCHVAPRRRAVGLVAAAADRFLLPEPELVEPDAESTLTPRPHRRSSRKAPRS